MCPLPKRVNLAFYYGKLKMTSFELFSRNSEPFNANANKMLSVIIVLKTKFGFNIYEAIKLTSDKLWRML